MDWEAFIHVQSLTITCEAQQLGSHASKPQAAASTIPPAAGTATIGNATSSSSLGMIGGEEEGGVIVATEEEEKTPTASLKALLGGKSSSESRLPLGLRELVLFGLSMGDNGMHDLWEGLSQYPYLTTLTLDGNDLTDAAMERLATVLEASSRGGSTSGAFTSLRLLQLSSNHIGDKGAARLLEAFSYAGLSLTSLDLTDNK